MKTFDELPVEIQEKMLERQSDQTGKRDDAVFRQIGTNAQSLKGGFDWEPTPEGWFFWDQIIEFGKYSYFYARYPKNPDPTIELTIDDIAEKFGVSPESIRIIK